MSFSIKQVKSILSTHNLPVDELDKCAEEICSRHAADLDSIKEERDSYKKDAEKLLDVQKQLDDLKAANTGEGSKDALQAKYDKLDKEFKDYKKAAEDEKTAAKTKEAYRELLKESGVSEKRIDTVLKVADLSAVKIGEDGKIADADKLKEGIKTEWADFIETKAAQGANPATPPAGNPTNPGNTGRAKQIANRYFEQLYGVKKEDA